MRRHPKNQSRPYSFPHGVDTKGLNGDQGARVGGAASRAISVLPKFDGVFADKPVGGFDCLCVVSAVEIDAKLDVAVLPDLISAVMRHVRQPQRAIRVRWSVFALACEAKTSVLKPLQTCTSAHSKKRPVAGE
jgi:hypothetical protein